MKKLVVLALSLVLLVACSSAPKDGTYQGNYTADDNSSSMSVELTITDGKISECTLIAYDQEGKIKDENYGKNAGAENFALAQKALAGMKQYPALLIEAQNVDDIDAVSGASVSLQEFRIAVKDALSNAK